MKAFMLSLVLASNTMAADIRVFMWQESRDDKTGERQFGFFVASNAAKEALEADPRGDAAKSEELAAKIPPEAWMYGVLLQGEAKTYVKEKISMFRGHDLIEVTSGHITVDLKKRTVEIGLEILEDEQRMPFPGNGIFTFVERPKR